LLYGSRIAASRQCQIWPKECCGAVALYGGEKTAVTYKWQKLCPVSVFYSAGFAEM
jgi:hypothetical protein